MLSSDLFVFLYIKENFPFTVIEAQSSGLPCPFSDITPLKNIVIEGKTCYYLPLGKDFEKIFSNKISEYKHPWETDYEKYRSIRIEIAEVTRRMCKEHVLPQLLDMVESFLKDESSSSEMVYG